MSEAKFTPGPWRWVGQGNGGIYLATEDRGRIFVMGFRRKGMRYAQPEFQPTGRGLVPAEDLLQFEVGDRSVVGMKAAMADPSVYRYDVRDIDCADARLIAAAPDLYEALKAMIKTHVTLGHSGDCGFYDPEEEPEVIAARAALAKAEGRT